MKYLNATQIWHYTCSYYVLHFKMSWYVNIMYKALNIRFGSGSKSRRWSDPVRGPVARTLVQQLTASQFPWHHPTSWYIESNAHTCSPVKAYLPELSMWWRYSLSHASSHYPQVFRCAAVNDLFLFTLRGCQNRSGLLEVVARNLS
jgi:hypothetical protein